MQFKIRISHNFEMTKLKIVLSFDTTLKKSKLLFGQIVSPLSDPHV